MRVLRTSKALAKTLFAAGGRSLMLLSFLLAVLTLSLRTTQAAAPAGSSPGWSADTIFHVDHGACSSLYVYLAGLDFDPSGRTVAGWSDGNGCGGAPITRWARADAGTWTVNTVVHPCHNEPGCFTTLGSGPSGTPPALALREDGNPFYVYQAPSDDVWMFDQWWYSLYIADLGADPNGYTATRMRNNMSASQLSYSTMAAAFAPGGVTPKYLYSAPGMYYLVLNGTTIQGQAPFDSASVGIGGAFKSVDYAVGPAGQDHVVYYRDTTGPTNNGAYYSNGTPGQEVFLARNSNLGSQVSVAVGPDNRIHVAIGQVWRAADVWDGGLLYATSSDGGATWSKSWVDVDRALGPSIAVDSAGVPHIAYWDPYMHLMYASPVAGGWASTRVQTFANHARVETALLAFDSSDQPHILFFNPDTNDVQVATGATVNQPPVVANPGAQLSGVNAAVSLQIVASDPESGTLTYWADNLPASLSINAFSGLITGTVQSSALAGSPYMVGVLVFDAQGNFTNVTFNWQVKHTANISVTKTDSPDPVLAGANLTYTVTVTNNGPDAAGVGLVDSLAAGLGHVSVSGTQGDCYFEGNAVECAFGTIASGGTATVTIVVTAPSPGTVTNSVVVIGDGFDSVSANNTATVQTTVSSPPTPTPTRTPTPTVPPTSTPTPVPGAVPGVSGPGLGIMAGVLLVLAVLFVYRLRRRSGRASA